MRKIFAGAMIFSVIGAVILGGALAWSSTFHIGPLTATVGDLAFRAIFTQEPNALIGPNGVSTHMGDIDIINTGDFNLVNRIASLENPGGSRVLILNVDASHASCAPSNFSGTLLTNNVIEINQLGLAPGKTALDALTVQLNVAATAPNACIGTIVSYDILLVMATANPA